MKFRIIFSCLLSLSFIACSGLKPNVGYVCKTCDDNLVTLDGDTFRLQETITPDLLIVCDSVSYTHLTLPTICSV